MERSVWVRATFVAAAALGIGWLGTAAPPGAVAVASAPVAVTRGPYLQQVTPTSAIVRFRTRDLVVGRVRFGQGIAALEREVTGARARDHRIVLDDLLPDTRYFYELSSPSSALVSARAVFELRTAPPVGIEAPVRIWAIGDSGQAGAKARAVRDGYAAFRAQREGDTDVWLLLGDSAYPSGSDADHQRALFDAYPEHLSSVAAWPTLGDHDARSVDAADPSGGYYDIFDLPTEGEAGGVPSGTEAYYAFDYANVHFVVLNSSANHVRRRDTMLEWLERDLARTTQDWIIATVHHPPYSKGSHDSDEEGRLERVRAELLPILEAGGVDLVLASHSRSYERSFLLNGHYGPSTSLEPTMILDRGDGRPRGDGAYRKPRLGKSAAAGVVHAVVGSSSNAVAAPLDHPAMVTSRAEIGSLVIDVDGPRLDAAFVQPGGVIGDAFTIVKGEPHDVDGDGVSDVDDNCPFVANPDQADRIGFAGAVGNGVGDACECGNVDGNGTIDMADVLELLQAVIAVRNGGVLQDDVAKSCNVTGRPVCDLTDVLALARAVAGLAPGVSSACAAAGGGTGYEGMRPYSGDEHIHSALSVQWRQMSAPDFDPATDCVHSYELPSTVYERCRANGLDFCAISHHSRHISRREGVEWWTDPANPDAFGIGTDPRGFPLPEGGYTRDELDWLQAVADGANDPGAFVAFYGIEYTAGAPGKCDDPREGAAHCGGHKIAVCPHRGVDARCYRGEGTGCDSEQGFYDFLRRNDCVGSAAHPRGSIPTYFGSVGEARFDASVIKGYEFAAHREFSLPGDDQIDRETAYNYVLGELGHRIGAVVGSDNHGRPPHCGSGEEPGEFDARMMCWAPALTRSGIASALARRRCYYSAGRLDPEVAFSLDGVPMGGTVALGDAPPESRVVRLFVRATLPAGVEQDHFRQMDVVHDGDVVIRGAPCADSGTSCELDRWLTEAEFGDLRGYWYLRVTDKPDGSALRVVTSPIWVE